MIDRLTCIAVPVPANGYLKGSGTDWACDRVFTRKENACVAFAVPDNAHLATYGEPWECDRGFVRRDDAYVQR